MVLPMVLVKLTEQIMCISNKVGNFGFLSKNPLNPLKQNPNPIPKFSRHDLLQRKPVLSDLVCDIDGVLIRPSSESIFFFPYFMLVAFEAGSILRSMLLLLSSPVLFLLNYQTQLKVMTFITFCGLRVKNMESVSRAVLPKFYLENLNFKVYEVWASCGFRVVVTGVPRVMVDGFLKEYLSADGVVGTELHVVGRCYSGLVSESGLILKHRAVKEFFGHKKKPDIGIVLGSSNIHDHFFLSLCKEVYIVSKEEMKKDPKSFIMPRDRYPKPVVFHDGRLAFLPTLLSTISLFMWLPFGIFLSPIRIFIGIFLPYNLAILLGSCTGLKMTVKRQNYPSSMLKKNSRKGVMYVCNHRTLLDPIFLSTAIGKPLTAVTYSLSKFSELIAPIKTIRLSRDRTQDGETIRKQLKEGDLVVCPEGTTCREPYLLRFSSLFAELAEEIVPVAMNTQVSMFYGTTAGGFKWLDPVLFLMNPDPLYEVEVFGNLPYELTCRAGRSELEVANCVQKQLGAALGFECTRLTRKDKYLLLAGNDGVC